MATNAELSILHTTSIPVPRKPKPPNIPPPHPATPKSQASATLSYAEASQLTPTQATSHLGKRQREGAIGDAADADHAVQHRKPKFKSPSKPNQLTSYPPLEPLTLPPASQDSDQVMDEDPFTSPFGNPPQSFDWSEEDRYYTRLNNIQSLLQKLNEELDKAQSEDSLASIVEDEETEGYLVKLASILPSFTTSSQISPITKGIADLKSMMEKFSQHIQNSAELCIQAQANKSMQGSMHAVPDHGRNPATPPTSLPPKQFANPPQQPGATAKHKTQTPSTQAAKIPNNPNSSHHPSRLVAQFLPKGVPDILRPDPGSIVTKLNSALALNQASKHLKVVAASFNTQGNLIISTRADQTASELLKYQEGLLPILTQIGNTNEVQLREDKKWFKIQIDAVNTSAISITNQKILLSGEAVHEELASCNPQYAQLQNTLVAKPRWLRSEEELTTTQRSSLVFATTDEHAARLILKQKYLAAFGRHCSVRAFQDRPPLTQCRNCWRLDHPTQQCKSERRCRICSGPHGEEDHQYTNPQNCHRCTQARELGDSMDTTAEGHCPHDLRCLNCLGNCNIDNNHPANARRCPARLNKYGTARENERRTRNSDNPWAKVKSKKPKQNPIPVRPLPSQTNASSSNRYSVLETPAPTAPIQLSEADALINFAS